MRPEQYKIDFEKLLYALELSETTIKQIQWIQKHTKERTLRIVWESRLQMRLIDTFCETKSYSLLDTIDKEILTDYYTRTERNLYENTKR